MGVASLAPCHRRRSVALPSGNTGLNCTSQPITNLEALVRITLHSHKQRPKLITSTVAGVKREVSPSHFLVSGNGTECLPVIVSAQRAATY